MHTFNGQRVRLYEVDMCLVTIFTQFKKIKNYSCFFFFNFLSSFIDLVNGIHLISILKVHLLISN